MGQKVNPHGARVGVIKDWSTRWYADKKNFADNLVSDAKLRKMIKELEFVDDKSKKPSSSTTPASLPSKSSAASTTKRRA